MKAAFKPCSRRKLILRILCYALFAFALFAAYFFLWGKLFISDFQSDVPDTLIWAKATLDSKSLVSPSFYYPYVLPFAGNILYLPFIFLFGSTITAIRASMSLFILILSAALIFFFRAALNLSRERSYLFSGLMLMLIETNRKLREIFFSHIIYYSLAVLFLLIMLALISRLTNRQANSKRRIFFLLLLICFLCAANGLPLIALTIAPILGACVLERIFACLKTRQLYAEWKREARVLALILLTAVIGLVVFVIVSHNANTAYGDQHTNLAPISTWLKNLLPLGHNWLMVLFQPEQIAGHEALIPFTLSYGTFMFILQALFMLVSPILLLILTIKQYHLLKTRIERITVLLFWVLAAITIILNIFTTMSYASWRMIPIFIMMFPCYGILLASLRKTKRILPTCLSALLLFFALSSGICAVMTTGNPQIWFERGSLIETLRANGLTHGFCDTFKLTSSTELITDNEIQIKWVQPYDGKLYPVLYQNYISDFDLPNERAPFFYIRTNDFDAPIPTGGKRIYRGKTYMPSHKKSGNHITEYEVFVYDKNPIEDYYYIAYSDHLITKDGAKIPLSDIKKAE